MAPPGICALCPDYLNPHGDVAVDSWRSRKESIGGKFGRWVDELAER